MNKVIVTTAMLLIYYHISGLATTNISRLTKGNTLPVLSSRCICDNCGCKIPALLQLPIFSYLFCKGKCRNCGCEIPKSGLYLEFAVLSGMCIIAFLTRFSPLGVIFSFLYYEIIRICSILLKGKREKDFFKQYVISVVFLLPFLLCVLFASLLHSMV